MQIGSGVRRVCAPRCTPCKLVRARNVRLHARNDNSIQSAKDHIAGEWGDLEHKLAEEAKGIKHAVSPPAGGTEPGVGERVSNGLLFGVSALLGATFLVSIFRYYTNYNKSESKARRKMLKNKLLVEELSNLLPTKRPELTAGKLRTLAFRTGFSATEMFRKWLWYVLRERKFDQEALDDLIYLKNKLRLTNEQVAQALRARCERIEKKYGNLMLNTEGLSQSGLQRKATCRALFSKMLYLIENESILKPTTTMSVDVLRDIFGATEEDLERLRIVSLEEVDLDVLDAMLAEKRGDQQYWPKRPSPYLQCWCGNEVLRAFVELQESEGVYMVRRALRTWPAMSMASSCRWQSSSTPLQCKQRDHGAWDAFFLLPSWYWS
eukprot:TRINITY_DN5133_c1_g1_i6.p1 TRINITY_DN5133_c1_g1~~TRINITY_DN5133_c1_g1_i6.p1  ORF type:complete len:379 (-),score=31.16 TRINITY_DN5133_c1_g1_i6:212-1348(-)